MKKKMSIINFIVICKEINTNEALFDENFYILHSTLQHLQAKIENVVGKFHNLNLLFILFVSYVIAIICHVTAHECKTCSYKTYLSRNK